MHLSPKIPKKKTNIQKASVLPYASNENGIGKLSFRLAFKGIKSLGLNLTKEVQGLDCTWEETKIKFLKRFKAFNVWGNKCCSHRGRQYFKTEIFHL